MKINKYSFSLIYRIKSFFKETPFYKIYLKYIINNLSKEIKKEQEEFLAKPKLFTHIEIETFNRCNNDCPFCPVNIKAEQRNFKKMDENLFKKIIDNLEELNYSSDISYYSNNEPLLDSRIYDFIKYGKDKLPNAKHILYTNGIIITPEKYIKLFKSGLDFLLIDNYSDDGKLIPSVQKLMDYFKDKENPYVDKIEIVLRRKTEVLSNRAGVAPNSKEVKAKLSISCYLPFKQLIIRPTGEISICCYDSYGQTKVGDLSKDKIEDIWFSKSHIKFLNHLHTKGRDGISLCEKCDTTASKNYQIGGITL